MGKQVGRPLEAFQREDQYKARKAREEFTRRTTINNMLKKMKCPTCGARMSQVPIPHDCKRPENWRFWRFVCETKVGDGYAVVSNFDPEIWAVYVAGIGITAMLPRQFIPIEWADEAYRDPNFDPNEKPPRRDPFAVRADDPPAVSFAVLREGYEMKGIYK